MSNSTESREARAVMIAAQNDTFRITGEGGIIVASPGIADLPPTLIQEITKAVRLFKDFEEGDDTYHEHDFGAFEHKGVGQVYFKIDYYNKAMDAGSEDPLDLTQTTRVMTIMLASEY